MTNDGAKLGPICGGVIVQVRVDEQWKVEAESSSDVREVDFHEEAAHSNSVWQTYNMYIVAHAPSAETNVKQVCGKMNTRCCLSTERMQPASSALPCYITPPGLRRRNRSEYYLSAVGGRAIAVQQVSPLVRATASMQLYVAYLGQYCSSH